MNKIIDFFGHNTWFGCFITLITGGIPNLAQWTMGAQLLWYVVGSIVGGITIYSWAKKNLKKKGNVYKADKSLEK